MTCTNPDCRHLWVPRSYIGSSPCCCLALKAARVAVRRSLARVKSWELSSRSVDGLAHDLLLEKGSFVLRGAGHDAP